MSHRTILEINHDYADEAFDQRSEFMALLYRALCSGAEEDWGRLRPFGVRRIVQAHHSDNRSVFVNGKVHPVP